MEGTSKSCRKQDLHGPRWPGGRNYETDASSVAFALLPDKIIFVLNRSTVEFYQNRCWLPDVCDFSPSSSCRIRRNKWQLLSCAEVSVANKSKNFAELIAKTKKSVCTSVLAKDVEEALLALHANAPAGEEFSVFFHCWQRIRKWQSANWNVKLLHRTNNEWYNKIVLVLWIHTKESLLPSDVWESR